MIKAKEVKAMTQEVRNKENTARMEKCTTFLNTVCEPAILEAAEKGYYEVFVKLPEELFSEAATITALIFCDGYTSQLRHGQHPAILIRWDRAK